MILALLRQLPLAFYRFATFKSKQLLGGSRGVPVDVFEANQSEPTTNNSYIGLDESLKEPVQWTANKDSSEDAVVQQTRVYQIWQQIPDGLKWSHYFEIYEKAFGSVQHQKLKVLEIGVYLGSSLQLWRAYFDHPESQIVGIDIDSNCARFDDPERLVHVMIGDQTDGEFLAKVVAEHGPFDIIIDDGSHISSHIIISFNNLFLNGLKETGIYFVEDLHANYFPGYRDSEMGFIDAAKQLVELMHSHYRKAPEVGPYVQGDVRQLESIEVPRVTTMLGEIRFFDSVVIINKVPLKHVPRLVTTLNP